MPGENQERIIDRLLVAEAEIAAMQPVVEAAQQWAKDPDIAAVQLLEALISYDARQKEPDNAV